MSRPLAGLRAGLIAAAAALSACHHDAAIAPAPHNGPVTDLGAFDHFIAGKPTPAQFHATYPDVKLVLPGEMSTRELRLNLSRYFAKLDAQGRIVGGRFQ
ncbi:hypothetical protein [Solimonas marina]|uniref:Uncharacterized protein n=1 Tax=Solimonas marina TaxID=2714601 RepID=A0A969W5P9_9GAMM|nr:hypothetical protein [Solimonas marina]NKF21131.1 hypothetical protein [Solimonas marina]